MKYSGVYRIFINDKSYINTSQNIEKQIKKDFKNIKTYLSNKTDSNNPNNLIWLLNFKTLPIWNEASFKIALYIIENDLSIKDINWEILKIKNYNYDIDILEEEIHFINKYNSDLAGFNNFTNLSKKVEKAINLNNNDISDNSIKKLLAKQDLKKYNIKRIIHEIINNDNSFSPWIYYNMKDYEIELKHHPKWLNYCDSMILKYKKWKNNDKKI